MDDPDHTPDPDDPEAGGDRVPIVRSVGLGCDVDAAWRLVSTADGLDRWLGTDVRLSPEVGGSVGLRDDAGVVRVGHVVAVDAGRSLTFEWEEVGDAASRATVTVTVEGDDDGTSTVTVEERPAGGRVATCADAGAAWDDRLVSLELDVLAGPLRRALAPAL